MTTFLSRPRLLKSICAQKAAFFLRRNIPKSQSLQGRGALPLQLLRVPANHASAASREAQRQKAGAVIAKCSLLPPFYVETEKKAFKPRQGFARQKEGVRGIHKKLYYRQSRVRHLAFAQAFPLARLCAFRMEHPRRLCQPKILLSKNILAANKAENRMEKLKLYHYLLFMYCFFPFHFKRLLPQAASWPLRDCDVAAQRNL